MPIKVIVLGMIVICLYYLYVLLGNGDVQKKTSDNYTGTYYYNFLEGTGDSDNWVVNFDEYTVTATISGEPYEPSEMTQEQRDYNWKLLHDHTDNPPGVYEPEVKWTKPEPLSKEKADEKGFINSSGHECLLYDLHDYYQFLSDELARGRAPWANTDFSKVVDYEDCCHIFEEIGIPTDGLREGSNYALINVDGPGWLTYFELQNFTESEKKCTATIRNTEYGLTTADAYSYILAFPVSVEAGTPVSFSSTANWWTHDSWPIKSDTIESTTDETTIIIKEPDEETKKALEEPSLDELREKGIIE